MSNSQYISSSEILSELISRYPRLAPLSPRISDFVSILNISWKDGGKLLVCGNGGSCADAGHIVGELMKSFKLRRPIKPEIREKLSAFPDGDGIADSLEGSLPAISLCAQTPLMTAFMNDSDASLVFAQQVYGYGRTGDVLLAISTSGNSKNCLNAAITAKALGIKVVSLTGAGGGKLAQLSDILIDVPESETFKVQELHLPVYHAVCAMVEADNFGG
jgi:phosphoheptose isomerase